MYVKEVALAMAAQGHRVDILTRRIEDPAWPEFAAPLDGYPGHTGVRIVRLSCGPPRFLPKEELWPHLGTDWRAGILRFYRAEGRLPDAFTAHYADGGLVAALLAAETGRPFTFTAHSLGAQKMDKLHATPQTLAALDARFHFKERLTAERIAMSRAGRLIVSTAQEQREQYTHRAYRGAVDPLGADAGRFAVIPPGVNRRIFSPQPGEGDAAIAERLDAALRRDLPPDRRALPLVLCASRLDRKKNHLGLVRAFAHSPDLRAAANLAIVVRGLENPLRQRDRLSGEEAAILGDIARLLDEHALWHAVTAFPLNSQTELAAAYRVAAGRRSVFALTAHYEPFGLAPLEAMSCGLPAVVTRNGGPAESLFDRQTGTRYGVLVDPADPADIARGLLEALSPPERWTRYRQAGMERVVRRYTWARTAEGYLSALADMLARPPRPAAPLPIPAWFTRPAPENEIPLAELRRLFGMEEAV